MTPEARERYLLGWAGSRIPQRRSAVGAFRKLLTFLAYAPGGDGLADPRLAALGFRTDDPPVAQRLTAVRVESLPGRPLGTGADDAPVTLDADAVIVGSGAGGGVIAAALAGAGRSVVVLEAGPFSDEATLPRRELDGFDRHYLDHGLTTTWDGSITMLAGTGVGGGTLINWMTCISAPEDVRAEWQTDHGLEGMTGEPWASDVAAIESELGVAESTHIPPKDAILVRGARALGWEAAPTRRNADACGDCGSCGFGCPRGTKRSGIRVHLAEASAARGSGGGRRAGQASDARGRTGGRRRSDGRAGERRPPPGRPRTDGRGGRRGTPHTGDPAGERSRAPAYRPPSAAPSCARRRGNVHGTRRDVAGHPAGRSIARILRPGGRPERLRDRVRAGAPRPHRARPALGRHRGPRPRHGRDRPHLPAHRGDPGRWRGPRNADQERRGPARLRARRDRHRDHAPCARLDGAPDAGRRSDRDRGPRVAARLVPPGSVR